MRGSRSPLRRLVALTVGAVTLATAPARAQRSARVEDFLGVTRCDSGQAVTEIREDVRRSELRAEVEAQRREARRRQRPEQRGDHRVEPVAPEPGVRMAQHGGGDRVARHDLVSR